MYLEHVGIPLYPLDLTDDFEKIIDTFATEYGAGRTPIHVSVAINGSNLDVSLTMPMQLMQHTLQRGTMQELFIVMTQAIMFPFQKFTEAMMSHVISHMSYLGSRRIVYLE